MTEAIATLELTDRPAQIELAAINEALTTFNDDDVGPSGRMPVAVLVRDADGRIAGGLSGFTAWGWLYTQWLFVPEALRGRGLAGQMLAMAEREAAARGCTGAWIDTFSPQALAVYRRGGYEVFGELSDFPPGRTRWFLRKGLQPSG